MVLSELEETCEERGWLQISSLAECKASTGYFRIYYPSYVEAKGLHSSKYPKGCFVYLGRSQPEGHFNTHNSGTSDNKSRALCTMPKGKKSKSYINCLMFFHFMNINI